MLQLTNISGPSIVVVQVNSDLIFSIHIIALKHLVFQKVHRP